MEFLVHVARCVIKKTSQRTQTILSSNFNKHNQTITPLIVKPLFVKIPRSPMKWEPKNQNYTDCCYNLPSPCESDKIEFDRCIGWKMNFPIHTNSSVTQIRTILQCQSVESPRTRENDRSREHARFPGLVPRPRKSRFSARSRLDYRGKGFNWFHRGATELLRRPRRSCLGLSRLA